MERGGGGNENILSRTHEHRSLPSHITQFRVHFRPSVGGFLSFKSFRNMESGLNNNCCLFLLKIKSMLDLCF